MKVLWVDTGIVTIPLFKIDVPSSSECVRFCTELNQITGLKAGGGGGVVVTSQAALCKHACGTTIGYTP